MFCIVRIFLGMLESWFICGNSIKDIMTKISLCSSIRISISIFPHFDQTQYSHTYAIDDEIELFFR